MKILILLTTFSLLSGCANGKYIGPPITFTGGYQGASASFRIDPDTGKRPVEVQK